MLTEERILEELFDVGYCTNTFRIGKISFKFRSTVSEDFVNIDSYMSDKKGSNNLLMQMYGLKKMSLCLISYKDKLVTPEQAEEILNKLAAPILFRLITEHNKLDDQVKKACTEEVISENFSQTATSLEKPGQ